MDGINHSYRHGRHGADMRMDQLESFKANNYVIDIYNSGGVSCSGPSKAQQVMGGIFGFAQLGLEAYLLTKQSGASDVSAASNSKIAMNVQLQQDQVALKTLTDQVAELKKDYISDADYESQKKALEANLANQDVICGGATKDKEGNIKQDPAYQSALTNYETACDAYDTAVENQKEAARLQSQLDSFTPLASYTGEQMDPKADSFPLENSAEYKKKFGDQAGAADSAKAKDRSRWAEKHQEYLDIKQKRDNLGDVDANVQKALNGKNEAKGAIDKVLTDLQEKGQGTKGITADQVLENKTAIQNKIKQLEDKHSRSADIKSEMNAMEKQIRTLQLKIKGETASIKRMDDADSEVDVQKAIKKGLKKSANDGNWFTRLFSKEKRANRKQYKNASNFVNEQLQKAQEEQYAAYQGLRPGSSS